jgi:hypothetical protein
MKHIMDTPSVSCTGKSMTTFTDKSKGQSVRNHVSTARASALLFWLWAAAAYLWALC